VLEEDRHEAFHRSEEGAVDHDRQRARVVGGDVGRVESLGRLEVELHRGHLVGATNGVASLHRDLGTVERAAAGVHHEFEPRGDRDTLERRFGLVPLLVGADGLARGRVESSK